jgi:serine/threonine protein kinase
MDTDRWSQIEQLYHSALQKEAGERAEFLRESCAADPSLRQEVESLLAVADDADGYLNAAVRGAFQPSGVNAAAAPQRETPTASSRLGRYQLLNEIGRGAMGVVYRALDPAIGRTVAIKTILLDDEAGEKSSERRRRLLRESQAGGQLSHPHIVAVHDVSEEGKTAYIVMEYVVGRTLDQAVSNDPSLRSVSQALRIVEECASALDYAHSRGVVHRDIKPANIMLQADGAVKIADFGIAKAAQFTPLTQSAVIVGSPHYMAAEQWKGEAVTGRTDQYALAAVAFGLLTGSRPFESDTMASLAAKALYEEPPAATSVNPALPASLDDVLRKALSKNAAARYETCSQFATALREACANPPATKFAPHPSAEAPRRSSRLVVVAYVLLLAAAAGAAWLYQRNSAAEIEIVYWTSIKDSKNIAPFEAYLKRYPEGQFAGLAQAQLTALKNRRPSEPNPQPPARQPKAPAKVNPTRTPEKFQEDSAHIPVSKPETPPAVDPYLQANSLLKSGAYAEALPYFS